MGNLQPRKPGIVEEDVVLFVFADLEDDLILIEIENICINVLGSLRDLVCLATPWKKGTWSAFFFFYGGGESFITNITSQCFLHQWYVFKGNSLGLIIYSWLFWLYQPRIHKTTVIQFNFTLFLKLWHTQTLKYDKVTELKKNYAPVRFNHYQVQHCLLLNLKLLNADFFSISYFFLYIASL